MNLTLLPAHLVARLEFATRLARQCGELALQEATQLQISAKGAHDVLTQADLAVERLIRAEVALAFAGDLVVGEEWGGPAHGKVNPKDRVWYLDPIDGTKSFITGKPLFGTLMCGFGGAVVVAGTAAVKLFDSESADLDPEIAGRLTLGEESYLLARVPPSRAPVLVKLRRSYQSDPAVCRIVHSHDSAWGRVPVQPLATLPPSELENPRSKAS